MPFLIYFDVILVTVATPIMLLIGVPAAGYLVGAGAWIALRALGVGVEKAASDTTILNRQIGLRMGFMLGRLFALALAIILVRRADGQAAGLTCLVVIVAAFSVYLATSALTRKRLR